MSLIFWKKSETRNEDDKHEPAREVNEQHALPVGLYWVAEGTQEAEAVGVGHPLPVYNLNSVSEPETHSAAFSFAAVSGDAVVIFGRADKTIKVIEIGIAKPSAQETVIITKRNSADTGGTSTLATNVPMDPEDLVSSTAVRVYTVAPTAGNSIGNVARAVVNITDVMVFSFKDWPKPPTLRNTTDVLAVNVDATATLPGWLVWTEEEPR